MPVEDLFSGSCSGHAGPVCGHQRHDDARRAESALQAVLFVQGGLHGVLDPVAFHALDGFDSRAVCLDGQHQAGPLGTAVDDDGAGPAGTLLASDVRAGETQLVPDQVGEEHPRLDPHLGVLAVDREADGVLIHDMDASARATRVPATWRRYPPVA